MGEDLVELKPCPFCGSADVLLVGFGEGEVAYIGCAGCGMETPMATTADEAAGAWNTRSESTTLQQQRREIEAMREALSKAAERFREYETGHRDKFDEMPHALAGDMIVEAESRWRKAERNREMAEICERALALSTPDNPKGEG